MSEDSRKEQILSRIESKLSLVKAGDIEPRTGYVYKHTISYIDRQYLVFDMDDVEEHPKPWVIVNNNGELFGNLPGKKFENKIFVDLVGFISASEENPNLDSLMNSLQKDIIVAILTDDNLSGLCSQIVVRLIQTVPEMIHPHGGFSIPIEITYTFMGLDM